MSRAALVRFAALCVLWGSSFLFIKLALEGLSPPQVVLGRLSAGAAVLWTIVALRRQRLPRDLVVWGHLALMGVVANVVPFLLFAWAEVRITSGLAGLLNGTTPLFTLAVAVAALAEERLTAVRAAGFGLGFLGVALVIGPDSLGIGPSAPGVTSVTGQLACLGAAASYGVGFVYTRRFLARRGLPALALAAGQLGCAALTLWLLAPLVATDPMDLTLSVVASVLALGGLGTGVAYIFYYGLLAEAGATTTSMVTYVVPVVAVALGALALGEPLTWNLFAGGAVVILGVAVAEGRLRRRPPTVDAPTVPPPR